MDIRKSSAPAVRGDVATVFVAIELSGKEWLTGLAAVTAMKAFNKLLFVIGAAMTALGLFAFLAGIVLFTQFSSTRPREPRPNEGRVYQLNNHGTVVYLTYDEHALIEAMHYMSWMAALGGTLLIYTKRKSVW
jgi:hypothetical protein